MKISIDWLRDFVPIAASPQALAEDLTLAGLEVDSLQPVAADFEGVIVAEILERRPHPEADRLSLCRVSDGRQELQIVCGAANADVGRKVPFAPVGAILPDGTRIRAAKIGGIRSEGMLCSARELGLSNDAEGLLILDPEARAGLNLREHLRLDDWIVEVDLTPNRGDCFSVIGIAREVAARQTGTSLAETLDCIDANSDQVFDVTISATAACPRFAGRVISGLATGSRSPDWLKERLRRAGLRPIHPVVDVTNYVMLEYGQPLHAYRLDRLTGAIDVRFAAAGEQLVLLDGQTLELDAESLVIADDSGAIGLAGIMGGLATAVDAATDAIFFESAFFSQDAIQGRARRYGLHTDASVRFERGVDPSGQERAVERATALLLAITGGQAGPIVLAEDESAVPARVAISLRAERVGAILGMAIAPDEIAGALERLGMLVESADAGWLVTPPSFRFDIGIEEDLIEEVGRMIGYDRIPVHPGQAGIQLGRAAESAIEAATLSDILVARGYHEIVSFGFTDGALQERLLGRGDSVALANPISSELGVLRQSLWPGLLDSARRNMSYQLDRCRLFECGTVFSEHAGAVRESRMIAGLASGTRWPVHWEGAGDHADFYDLKGDVAALLACWRQGEAIRFEARENPALRPSASAAILRDDTVAGYIGLLHPALQRSLDIRQNVVLFEIDLEMLGDSDLPKLVEFSKLPGVTRDLAVVVDDATPVAELTKHVAAVLGDSLKACEVFDIYRGQGVDTGRKSVAMGLILQGTSRTLTDQETDDMILQVMRRLEHELGATIRS